MTSRPHHQHPTDGSHDHRHDQRHSHDDHSGPDGQDALADLLDLDAEVLADALRSIRADIAALADGPVRSILDLGAGTGTGTFGLVQHFNEAHVLAVDGSAEMLARLQHRATGLGLDQRVTTRQADLDAGLPDGEPVDVVWASASLHHLADPDRTLAEVADRVRPGGLVAIVELTGFPRFVADDAPGGAAEAAAHALLAADRADDMPTMGSDWGSRLAHAGLVVELDRAVVVDLAAPLPTVAREFAFGTLSRIRDYLGDRLDPADRQALDRLLDDGPTDVRRRSDLQVKTERHLCIARRPRLG